jgi:hypothetical protein
MPSAEKKRIVHARVDGRADDDATDDQPSACEAVLCGSERDDEDTFRDRQAK